jgi:hypothetical protein
MSQTQSSRPQPGFFDPTLMHPLPQPPVAAGPGQPMQSSMRKRSATEPSQTSPPLAGSIMTSTTAAAIFHATAAMNIPVNKRHAMQPEEAPTLPSPSTSAPEKTVPPPPPPPPLPKKESSSSKMKIFSKPGRIGTPGIEKTLRPPPSPSRMPQISSPIPRLVAADGDGRRPSYPNSGTEAGYSESPPAATTATIVERGFLSSKEEGERKKEREHHSHKPHFLRSRRDKEHAFSSSNSNSKVAADAAASLYNFSPSSPSSTVFSSSALTLQRSISNMDIATPSTKSSKTTAFKSALGAGSSSNTTYEEGGFLIPSDPETAWSILCARVLPLFDGDPLRNTVEDLNKLVSMNIKRCVDRRDPVMLLHDVRKLLETGMSSIEPRLSDLPDERLLQRLVEIWALVFGYITPYFEAVFLPLQQEFKGAGSILSARESNEFFGGNVAETAGSPMGLDVRRLVMIAVRDCILLPVYERLRVLFSRLQLDFSGSSEEGMEVVGRMLQCVSVLAAAGTGDEKQGMLDELGRRLKWNWLSRGRTGRNRMGFVGQKMRPVVASVGGGDVL